MKLETFLREKNVQFEKHVHPKAYTAQELAQSEHVSGYVVAKPVIVNSNAGFVMCVLAAPKHVDLDRVAAAIDTSGVRLATESEMAGLFPDCELGAEPPVGPMFDLRTVMDTGLTDAEFLVMQSGSHSESIKIRLDDWQRVCKPQTARIST